jgi:Flp pilus assembly protein TadD
VPEHHKEHPKLSEARDLHARGDKAGAAALCRVILSETPDDPGALHLLGVIMSEVGLHSQALPIFEQAIAKGGVEPILLYNYGMALRALGNLTLAARAFRLAANGAVTDAESWVALGTTRLALKQFEAAMPALQTAADLAPRRADIHASLTLAEIGSGLAQQRARAFEGAYETLSAATRHAPDNAQTHANLGNVLRDMGRFSDAQAAFARALALAPDDAGVIANQALSHLHEGALDAAIAGYRRASALAPGNEPIRSSLAQALLMAGRFAEGWAEFEHRLADPAIARRLIGLPGKRWRGETVAGRTLLLRCEQGLGDTIQFARYVPILAGMGATVYLVGPARLARLTSGLAGLAGYVTEDAPLPAADLHAPLLSVPHLLKEEAVRHAAPYLSAEPTLVTQWGKRLDASAERPRIGIAWQGNPAYEMDYLRSIPAAHVAELIRGLDARFLILQRGDVPQSVRDAGGEDLGCDLDRDDAFVDTAAIMANLDLVITSDTAIAHLAGALGRPAWILLPSAPDWRWRLRGSSCDWYASLRLIRQPRAGDWAGAVAEARAALVSDI